jgi:Skp family chaperone for outer membrane proteins
LSAAALFEAAALIVFRVRKVTFMPPSRSLYDMIRNSIRSLLLLLGVTLAFTSVTVAQTKVAYLDASKLLKRMPEAKDAESRMNQLVGTWTKESGEMQAEIDRKQSDFDRRKLIMTEAERSTSVLELETLRKRLDDYRHQKFDENGGELFTQQQLLMKPAYEKLSTAIKDVAGDLGFDYVIDRSSHDVVLLYTNTKYDLTIPVARKLGIENELISTPLVPSSNSGAAKPSTPPGAVPSAPATQQVSQNPLQAPPPTQQMPQQPGFNSGTFNPGQVPPPPDKH